MGIEIYQGSSLDFVGDAIVNAANPVLLGGSGIDGAIHRACGPQLRAFNEGLPEIEPGIRLQTGDVRVSPAFDHCHMVRWIISTVGPFRGKTPPYEGVFASENQEELGYWLFRCYQNIFNVAAAYGMTRIALCPISTGIFGVPLEVSLRALNEAYQNYEADPTLDALDVTLCCFRPEEAEAAFDIFSPPE